MADPDNAIPPKPFSMVANLQNRYKYEGITLSKMMTPEVIDAIRNMEVREDDVILTSYPKCGTHWMVEILLLARNSGFPISSQDRADDMKSGLLELPLPHMNRVTSYEELVKMPSPRIYVTHLPIQLLPKQIWEKKPKIVYVARNPRDCLVSFYNFIQPDPQPLTWEETFNLFLTDDMTYNSVWDHQYGFWKHRDDDNILYVNFENMKKDPAGIVAKAAAHIGCDLSPEQLAEVTRLSSLAEMKKTFARIEEELGEKGKFLTRAAGILPFLHKGTVGGWKNIFTVAQDEIFQQYQDMKIQGFDKDFKL